jgi:hypothetical protein
MLIKDIEYQINPIPNLDLVPSSGDSLLFLRLHHLYNMEYLTWFELVSDDEKIYSLCEHLLVDFFQLPTS